jgi:glycosyltransferase involved in cell wall biosynthesis
MHIAQVAPLTEAIPPKLYGGTERVVSWLTEELIALGHEVTLFASGDSVTSAQLDAVWPRALRLDGAVRDPNALHMLMLERVYRRAADFDFLHFHLDYYPFSLFSRQPTPFITTLHGRLDLPEHQPVFDTHFPRCRWCRSPIRSGGRCRRRIGCAPSIMACPSGCSCPSRSSRPISPSSAASPRKRASTAPSASPSIAA